MLKTYRIIPLVFILFLFGFTLITVAPVFAQGQWNPSMGMCHNSRPCIKSNMCGSECAPHVRESKGWVKPNDTGVHSPMPTSTSPSGGEVAELNAKISQLEAGLTDLKGVVMALQEQSKNSMQQGASNAPSGGGVDQLISRINLLEEIIFPKRKRIMFQTCVTSGSTLELGPRWEVPYHDCARGGIRETKWDPRCTKNANGVVRCKIHTMDGRDIIR
jgi:hypothetical protein